MNLFKIWLNIAPFLPIIGIPISIYHFKYYNTNYKNVGRFGLNSTPLLITVGVYQGALLGIVLLELINYLV